MDRRETSEYVWLGSCLRYLLDVREGYAIHGDGTVLYNLRLFQEQLEKLSLSVSRRAALYWCGLPDIDADLAKSPDDAGLSAAQASTLQKAMDRMRHVVLAEASGMYAFVVTEKRFSVEKLLDAPEELFAPGAFATLPEGAREDYRQAGRCIAYEVPTAAAFHLMRATESVLRDYYLAVVKQKRVDPLLWGPMVRHLRARKTRRSPVALLDELDSIRINYRNPTQHPDAVYDIHQAQALWGLCVDVADRATRAKPQA